MVQVNISQLDSSCIKVTIRHKVVLDAVIQSCTINVQLKQFFKAGLKWQGYRLRGG